MGYKLSRTDQFDFFYQGGPIMKIENITNMKHINLGFDDSLKKVFIRNLESLTKIDIIDCINLETVSIEEDTNTVEIINIKRSRNLYIMPQFYFRLHTLILSDIKNLSVKLSSDFRNLKKLDIKNCYFSGEVLSISRDVNKLEHFSLTHCDLISLNINFPVRRIVHFDISHNMLEKLKIKHRFHNIRRLRLTDNLFIKPKLNISTQVCSNKRRLTIFIDEGTKLPKKIKSVIEDCRVIVSIENRKNIIKPRVIEYY